MKDFTIGFISGATWVMAWYFYQEHKKAEAKLWKLKDKQ